MSTYRAPETFARSARKSSDITIPSSSVGFASIPSLGVGGLWWCCSAFTFLFFLHRRELSHHSCIYDYHTSRSHAYNSCIWHDHYFRHLIRNFHPTKSPLAREWLRQQHNIKKTYIQAHFRRLTNAKIARSRQFMSALNNRSAQIFKPCPYFFPFR